MPRPVLRKMASMPKSNTASVRPRFSDDERERLLKVRGVGPAVIQRLEEVGFSRLGELADAEPAEVNEAVARMLGATCWANSPLARKAVVEVVALAKRARARSADSKG